MIVMTMSQKKLNNYVNQIFNEIQEDGINLTHEVRAALRRLVETTPSTDELRFDTPYNQVMWLLKHCAFTADEIKTCIVEAAQPLPGDIAITDDVLESLGQMVQNIVSTKTSNWLADISGTTFQWANEIALVHNNVVHASINKILDQCTKKLISTCTDEINSKGPHYQFSWLTENGYSEKEIIKKLRNPDHDISLTPGPD